MVLPDSGDQMLSKPSRLLLGVLVFALGLGLGCVAVLLNALVVTLTPM